MSNLLVNRNAGSHSSAEYKNSSRSTSSVYKIEQQALGDRPDLCFTYLTNEIGCVEIGLADHGANGTKELNEAKIKVPMMLKSFHQRIASQYDISANNAKVVGFVISGESRFDSNKNVY